jgi:hypothetical protein
MLRYLTNKRKQTRKEKNHDAIKTIFARGASSLPAEYLTVHQEASRATKEKLITAAEQRRARRNAKRLEEQEKQNAGRNRHS